MPGHNDIANDTNNDTFAVIMDTSQHNEEDGPFASWRMSIVKTLVMFIGELDYSDLTFEHWLVYIIFVLFLFLIVIVLMNVLNGLAVSDIAKIEEEVDTKNAISKANRLAYTRSVSLQAKEITFAPNTGPQQKKIFGILPIPFMEQVYKTQGTNSLGQKKDFYFRVETVMALKELVVAKAPEEQLDQINDDLHLVLKEQEDMKIKMEKIEDLAKKMENIEELLDRIVKNK